MNETLVNAVADLPEIYQQIYGHPELSQNASRACMDRWAVIQRVVEKLQAYTGRKELEVLDIGCAQGFYSLSLAKMGCRVHGIDGSPENIRVCQILREENEAGNCTFAEGMLTPEYAETLSRKYDLILTLSVMHHVALQNGYPAAKEIFEKLSACGSVVISEMALKEEPLYWNVHLPEQYEDWFQNICFFDELCSIGTHLSAVARPLIFSSNSLICLRDRLYPIDDYSNAAYALKRRDFAKRYYRSGDLFIKIMRSTNPTGKEELEKEIAFVQEHGDLSFIEGDLDQETGEKRTWCIRKFLPGKLLYDLAKEQEGFVWDGVFLSLLEQLAELEEHGYYHGDLRAWNVICDLETGRVSLIDFGMMRIDAEDSLARAISGTGRFTVYDAYISIVYDTLTRKEHPYITTYGIYDPGVFYDVTILEPRYRHFIKAYLLWRETLNYRGIRELFIRYVMENGDPQFTPREEARIAEALIARCQDYAAGKIAACAAQMDHQFQINQMKDREREMMRRLEGMAESNDQLRERLARAEETNAENLRRLEAAREENSELRNRINHEIAGLTEGMERLRSENEELRHEVWEIRHLAPLRLYQKVRGRR